MLQFMGSQRVRYELVMALHLSKGLAYYIPSTVLAQGTRAMCKADKFPDLGEDMLR